MKIYIDNLDEEKDVSFSGKVIELLKDLDINPEEVLVVKNGELLTDEDKVSNEDFIKVLSVVSGG